MLKEWYVSMENKPFGPLDFETVGNMLNNRTILFVDYIWKKDFEQWKRICEVDTFELLLPKIPDFSVETLEAESSQIDSVEEFIKEKEEEKKVEIKTRSQIRGKREISEISGEVVIHDDIQVFHGTLYGFTEDEFFVHCHKQNIPINKDLFLIVSPDDVEGVFHCKGSVGGISKTAPVGYCLNIKDMPENFLQRVK